MLDFKRYTIIVIAIFTVGFTIATKAKSHSEKFITDCFESLIIINSDGDTSSLTSGLLTSKALARSISYPYVQGISMSTKNDQCIGSSNFCCAEIIITEDIKAPLVIIDKSKNRYTLSKMSFKD